METLKSVRVGEGCWRALKQRALDEGVTVRAVVEGLVFGGTKKVAEEPKVSEPVRELVRVPEVEAIAASAVGVCQRKGCGHWVAQHVGGRCLAKGCVCQGVVR